MYKPKKAYSHRINVMPEKEGGYTVLVPQLPDCVSFGTTIEEATKHTREAMELHLANLAAYGQPIPEGNETAPIFTTLVHVTLSQA
jgi:predicted RNase H-like HicB family nuclease